MNCEQRDIAETIEEYDQPLKGIDLVVYPTARNSYCSKRCNCLKLKLQVKCWSIKWDITRSGTFKREREMIAKNPRRCAALRSQRLLFVALECSHLLFNYNSGTSPRQQRPGGSQYVSGKHYWQGSRICAYCQEFHGTVSINIAMINQKCNCPSKSVWKVFTRNNDRSHGGQRLQRTFHVIGSGFDGYLFSCMPLKGDSKRPS